MTLLQSIPVDDLNATLSGLAAALDGRGDDLGAMLTDLDAYVTEARQKMYSIREELEK